MIASMAMDEEHLMRLLWIVIAVLACLAFVFFVLGVFLRDPGNCVCYCSECGKTWVVRKKSRKDHLNVDYLCICGDCKRAVLSEYTT